MSNQYKSEFFLLSEFFIKFPSVECIHFCNASLLFSSVCILGKQFSMQWMKEYLITWKYSTVYELTRFPCPLVSSCSYIHYNQSSVLHHFINMINTDEPLLFVLKYHRHYQALCASKNSHILLSLFQFYQPRFIFDKKRTAGQRPPRQQCKCCIFFNYCLIYFEND